MIKKYDVLISSARKQPNGESEKAEAMFSSFISKGFSYDDISNHPDYTVYASVEMLLDMIPWIIDEMLRRKDTVNYLIYPVIMNIDLYAYNDIPTAKERVKKLISLANKNFTKKAYQFLDALADDPPIPQEDFERVRSFWQNKLKELK